MISILGRPPRPRVRHRVHLAREYGPSVLELIRLAKTTDEVADVVLRANKEISAASADTRRKWAQAATARLEQLEVERLRPSSAALIVVP